MTFGRKLMAAATTLLQIRKDAWKQAPQPPRGPYATSASPSI